MTKKPEKKYAIYFKKPSLTKQCFRDESNINSIMARYESTGMVEHINKNQGSYGDFTKIDSYQEAQNKIQLAQTYFEALPAELRKKFDNNPAEFYEFAQNPENIPEMQELGILPKPEIPPEAPVEPPEQLKPEKDTKPTE